MKAGENIKWFKEGDEVPDGARIVFFERRPENGPLVEASELEKKLYTISGVRDTPLAVWINWYLYEVPQDPIAWKCQRCGEFKEDKKPESGYCNVCGWNGWEKLIKRPGESWRIFDE